MKRVSAARRHSVGSLVAVAAVAITTCALAIALAPLALRTVASAKDEAKPAKLKKNQAWVAPDFATQGVRAIAFAPVSSFDRSPESEKYVQQYVEPGFAQLKYRFVSQATTMDRVRRGEAQKSMDALHAAFLAGEPIDTALTHAVAAQVGTDAMIFTHVTQWQRYVVDAQTRGQSFTQVGVEMTMISLKDGRPLWRGNFQEKGDGPYNDPSTQQVTERDPGGNQQGKRSQLDPPSYPEVLEKLVGRAAKAMPPPPPAG